MIHKIWEEAGLGENRDRYGYVAKTEQIGSPDEWTWDIFEYSH